MGAKKLSQFENEVQSSSGDFQFIEQFFDDLSREMNGLWRAQIRFGDFKVAKMDGVQRTCSVDEVVNGVLDVLNRNLEGELHTRLLEQVPELERVLRQVLSKGKSIKQFIPEDPIWHGHEQLFRFLFEFDDRKYVLQASTASIVGKRR